MKWFVTDAQLDALRDAIADAHLQMCQGTVQALTARHEAEIARLREDRREELTRLADPHGPFVAHLRDEVAYWRIQFMHERQRAELAVDQCRTTHAQIGPVSVPLREEGVARDAMALFQSNPELAMMGSTEGV